MLKFHRTRDYAATKRSLKYKCFANTWFKEGPLQSQNFVVHNSEIFANLALSNNESFVVTGGRYECKESVLKFHWTAVRNPKGTEAYCGIQRQSRLQRCAMRLSHQPRRSPHFQ